MESKKTLIFATSNPNKIVEINTILPEGYILKGLEDIGFTEELPETSDTLEGNAQQKAQYLFDQIKMACFSEDTGLEVEALDGAPGVYSARYAGKERDHAKNIALLLKNLEGISNRKARFKTCICYINDSGEVNLFEGIIDGEILEEPCGEGGFGYDPVFKPNGFSHSFAQMSPDTKSIISHRGKAFQEFMKYIQ